MRAVVKRVAPAGVVAGLRRARGVARAVAARAARVAFPPPPPAAPPGKVYLNLGCGHVTHPAFTNVDALTARHIHHVRPVDDLRPFADGAVDLVYVSHCLEHFGHREVPRVLAEWRRVLKPGGVLRLGVPDFDVLLAMYEAAGRDVAAIEQYLMGAQTYPLNAHYSVFTRRSLTAHLTAAGFREVRGWDRGADELTSLPDCTALTAEVGGRVLPISLNLEAVK